jgi:tetratricopeptide (TPR) repeat protein
VLQLHFAERYYQAIADELRLVVREIRITMRKHALFLLAACIFNPVHAVEPLKINVSKETTYITEPLGEDGLPDYRRAWLERLRKKKVPGSENGAVDYWQVVGLESVDEKYRQAFCDELGMPMPKADELLESVDSPAVSRAKAIWYLQRLGESVDDATYDAYCESHPDQYWEAEAWPTTWDSIHAVISYPVSEVPPLTEWLARNDSKLDRVVAALEKPGWYDPPPTVCAAGSLTDIGMRAFEWRGVMQSLAVRAQVLMERGDRESALRDLKAIHRLGELNSPDTWLDLLVSTAGKRLYAAPVELRLITDSQASDSLLAKLQSLRPLSIPTSRLPHTLQSGERLYALSFALALLRKEPEAMDVLPLLLPVDDEGGELQLKWIEQLLDLPIDGSQLLTGVNQDCDATLQTLSKGSLQQRVKELKEQLSSPTDGMQIIQRTPASLTPAERADALRVLTNQSDFGTADGLVVSEANHATHSQLMHLALALGRYRLAEGQYPAALDALVPRFVPELPADAFGNETLDYRKTDKGFLLYSYGLNGVDDGGSHHDMEIYQGYAAGGYDAQVRTLLGGDDIPDAGDLTDRIPAESDDVSIRIPLIHVPLPGPDPS